MLHKLAKTEGVLGVFVETAVACGEEQLLCLADELSDLPAAACLDPATVAAEMALLEGALRTVIYIYI